MKCFRCNSQIYAHQQLTLISDGALSQRQHMLCSNAWEIRCSGVSRCWTNATARLSSQSNTSRKAPGTASNSSVDNGVCRCSVATDNHIRKGGLREGLLCSIRGVPRSWCREPFYSVGKVCRVVLVRCRAQIACRKVPQEAEISA